MTDIPVKKKRDRTHWLYIAVIVAVLAGIVVGLRRARDRLELGVLGTLFVSLIKMMISPVIFCTIVLGIGSVRKAASVGKVGGLALAYFLAMSTVALGIGLVVGNLISPGTGLNIAADPSAGAELAEKARVAGGTMDFIEHIIPTSLLSSLTEGNVLQALFVALLVGFACRRWARAGEPMLRGIGLVQKLVFRILAGILWLAPDRRVRRDRESGRRHRFRRGHPAGRADGGLLPHLRHLRVRCARRAAALRRRPSIFKLVRYLAREYLLIVATSSSESALPRLIAKMEHAGVQPATVGIVVPTGYSFNLDGTAIYLTMASLFIADAMGNPLSIGEQSGPAGVHDHRVQGRRRRQRCGACHPGRWSAEPPPRTARRHRPDRRHRPVHVRGPRGHQLLRQRGRDGARRCVDQVAGQGADGRGARRQGAVRRADHGRRPRAPTSPRTRRGPSGLTRRM